MRQWTIDAFAQAPFRGNPACVVEPFDAWPADAWMQTLAAENNQAETAFLLRTESADRFGLRWFTPALEVPLCGHATLASAHALFAELGLTTEAVTFDTLSGPLIVSRQDGGYAMDFPASPVRQVETPAGLAEALGVEPNEVWAGPFLVAVLKDEAAVRAATPDLAALTTISSAATQGRGNVGVSALAGGQPYDVVSRFFAPGSGIPEDPATGSLHCMLSPIFAQKLGRTRLDFHQAYPGRGGDLDCELAGDRVILRGQAVTVMDSRLRL
ncbi:PhzF family phenazine biosynthesis protein [Phenylobacterium sp.]|jgi:PhzF family phenazine biosynthesis protein|uniref:PhzF family phenazine biosynthesis protein n=1 Tax=Phenylobacterium sp. TaxID=1871053 RepID=UPI000C926E70|nr:PhzF family phenazine biosynthesis protein [Phenylobacterium sp.]MAK82220.1 isomerase [Phenylobacterium sp.]|tara:strand:- start:7537 stop:8346 length:810 start_codon:yes stop_codon:yes gene_type:complete